MQKTAIASIINLHVPNDISVFTKYMKKHHPYHLRAIQGIALIIIIYLKTALLE